jgi:hypothetical protein
MVNGPRIVSRYTTNSPTTDTTEPRQSVCEDSGHSSSSTSDSDKPSDGISPTTDHTLTRWPLDQLLAAIPQSLCVLAALFEVGVFQF